MDKPCLLVLLTALLLTGCMQSQHAIIPSASPTAINSPSLSDKVPVKALIANETFRLEDLYFQRNLTIEDLNKLEGLTNQDPEELEGEFKELKWFVERNFTKHVAHTLAGIGNIALNKTIACPSDALSHVGLFLQYNETGMALDALREGQEQMPGWIMQVKEARKRNPNAYANFQQAVEVMNREINETLAGDYAASIRDSAFVDANVSC